MIRVLVLCTLVLSLVCTAPLAERLATSGMFTVDLDDPPGDAIYSSGVGTLDRANILVNPGWESGDMAPWTTQAWVVSTDNPHAGTYCAYDVGNNWVRQDFTPIDVTQITSISLWERQPEIAISAVDFYYSATDYDEFLVFLSTSGWEFFDVTSELRPTGMLQAIRIWGYSGGGGAPDETFLDDVLIDTGITPVGENTWGEIKSLFR